MRRAPSTKANRTGKLPRGSGHQRAYRGFMRTSIIPGLALRGSRRALGKDPKFQGRPTSPRGSTRPTKGSATSRCLSSSGEPCSSPHRLDRFHVTGNGAWTKSRVSSRARGAASLSGDCQRSSGAGWGSSSFPGACLFSKQRLLLSPPVTERNCQRGRRPGFLKSRLSNAPGQQEGTLKCLW